MNIRRGDRGDEVKALQRALNAHDFNLDDDGIFGAKTEEAVKTFQRLNGLDDDGIAGKDTLRALGLDPDTLQPLSGDGSTADEEVITFTEEDVTVPPVVKQRIREFAEKAVEQRSKLLMSTLNALAQFETTMAHASASEANPDVLGALVSKAVGEAIDTMISEVPGLSEVKSIYDTVTGELERAGKARQSLEMGDWIKDQRAVIDGSMQNVNLDDLLFELEEGYLDLDQAGRTQFVQRLFEGSQRMQNLTLADIDELECKFYEQWINAHFTSIGDDTDGCIEFRYEYDDNTFDFESCEVKAPSGDKIESAINRLLDRGQISGVQKPIDLKVRKRASFWVDNFVGGKSWSSGWLDADNQNIHSPIHDAAIEAFNDPTWRQALRFGQA
jgi:hypothetical protein